MKAQLDNVENECGTLEESKLPPSTTITDMATSKIESKIVPQVEEDAKDDLQEKENCNTMETPQDGTENEKLAENNVPNDCVSKASESESKNEKSLEDSVLPNGTSFIEDTTSGENTAEVITKEVDEVPQGSAVKGTIDAVQDKDLDDESGGILRKVIDGLPSTTIESDGLPSNANELEEIDLQKLNDPELTNECSQVEEGNDNTDDTTQLIGNI